MDSTLLMLAWSQLWQVTVLVVAVAVVVRLEARNRPHLAYALWLVVLVKCVTPPVWASSSGVFCWLQPEDLVARTEPTASNSDASLQTPPGLDEVVVPPCPVETMPVAVSKPVAAPEPTPMRFTRSDVAVFGLTLWAVGAAVSLALSVWRWRASLRTASRTGQDGEFEEHVEALAVRLGLRRQVRVIVTRGQLGPAVTGVLRPKLLIPEGMLAGKTQDELEPILVHELIHFRRGDLWVGLLQTVVLALWWFHPLVRWAVRESMGEAERCCDEAVLAELGCRPKEYARSLLDVLQYKAEWAPAAVFPGAGRVDATARRLERIMRLGQGCRRRSPWWCWVVMFAVAVVVLPGGAFVVSGEEECRVGETSEDAAGVAERSVSLHAPDRPFRIPGTNIYEVGEVLSEIGEVTGSREEAKKKLIESFGFEVNGTSGERGDSRIRFMEDDAMLALVTEAEHETICAELEVIREFGCPELFINVLCLIGSPEGIRNLVDERALAEESSTLASESDSESLTGMVSPHVRGASLPKTIWQFRGNEGVRVLAKPQFLARSCGKSLLQIGEGFPRGLEPFGGPRETTIGLWMQFEPRLKERGKWLLHSDVKMFDHAYTGRQGRQPMRATDRLEWPAPRWSRIFVENSTIFEVSSTEGQESVHKASHARLAPTTEIPSRHVSWTSVEPVGETVAMYMEGFSNEQGESQQVLILVRTESIFYSAGIPWYR